jgi:hypothetical protein
MSIIYRHERIDAKGNHGDLCYRYNLTNGERVYVYGDGLTCSVCGDVNVIRSGAPTDKLLCLSCAKGQGGSDDGIGIHR